jgi:hypothetical protein
MTSKGLMEMVTPLQPPIFVQTLAVKKHKSEHRPVVVLVHLFGHMAQVECKNFIAIHLILFLF